MVTGYRKLFEMVCERYRRLIGSEFPLGSRARFGKLGQLCQNCVLVDSVGFQLLLQGITWMRRVCETYKKRIPLSQFGSARVFVMLFAVNL